MALPSCPLVAVALTLESVRELSALCLVLMISSLQVCRMTMCMSIISVSQSLNPTNWSQICGNSRQSWGCQDAELQVVCILPRAMDLPMANADLSLIWCGGFPGCASSVVRDKAERGTYTSTAKIFNGRGTHCQVEQQSWEQFWGSVYKPDDPSSRKEEHRPQPSKIPRDHT